MRVRPSRGPPFNGDGSLAAGGKVEQYCCDSGTAQAPDGAYEPSGAKEPGGADAPDVA